ncbi:hypothetical protein Ahy_B01g053652 isoform B [Arachis hypogaea]|uniref:Transposase MuDR plant domain-containing protein n=1 Tax=Arachis hypogaea TaxID=3818 RepID=A0A445AS66_ARAHY|nr:hypothetical protein Ahy_B01g053652 isoform B [Arachis hypogaea]
MLDLDAMRQQADHSEHVGFGARGTQQGGGEGTEFQVGQQFQDKEEAVLSLKTYSIQRGVQYKVVESDYRKYYGKFNEFGNGCTWCIRISLRQRKGIWEVKRYNGPHTCLATLISSDHRSLDYHVISAFIMPMVRADAAVSLDYPVHVGGQVDDAHAYFHNLFWTFPPCFETFRHCKLLVSIDGTHLYGKYGGTFLVTIAQDGNSNILPLHLHWWRVKMLSHGCFLSPTSASTSLRSQAS